MGQMGKYRLFQKRHFFYSLVLVLAGLAGVGRKFEK
jgi:hypothetical protein